MLFTSVIFFNYNGMMFNSCVKIKSVTADMVNRCCLKKTLISFFFLYLQLFHSGASTACIKLAEDLKEGDIMQLGYIAGGGREIAFGDLADPNKTIWKHKRGDLKDLATVTATQKCSAWVLGRINTLAENDPNFFEKEKTPVSRSSSSSSSFTSLVVKKKKKRIVVSSSSSPGSSLFNFLN